MSLTSVLKADTALAHRLTGLVPAEEITDPRQLSLKAPPLTKHYSLVGTAFDYLFRFEVQRRNPSAIARRWVASVAVELLKPVKGNREGAALALPGVDDQVAVAAEAEDILREAEACVVAYVKLEKPSDLQLAEAARHAIRLAKLDVIYRAGIVDPALGSTDPLDVRDLTGLLRVVPFEGAMAPCLLGKVWLNPTFGRFSVGIQGADADIVTSTMLIDLKTTIKPDFRPHLPQIVGYAMLAEAYRTDGATEFPLVESVGLYLARQGALISLPMTPVRQNRDFRGTFEALMNHCREAPLSLEDVRAMKTDSAPRGSVRKAQPTKRGR
jgi:hypothetical protein